MVRVLMFDHPLDAITLRDDTAIALRVLGLKAQHDHRRIVISVEPVDHQLHRFGRHERHVTVENEHIAVEPRQRRLGLLHRMAGAMLRFLHREFRQKVTVTFLERGLQLLLATADDHDLLRRV